MGALFYGVLMKVKFIRTYDYNGAIYAANEVYEIKDEPKGFVNRWIKRGCELVNDVKVKAKADPRLPKTKEVKLAKSAAEKPVKPAAEKPVKPIAEKPVKEVKPNK